MDGMLVNRNCLTVIFPDLAIAHSAGKVYPGTALCHLKIPLFVLVGQKMGRGMGLGWGTWIVQGMRNPRIGHDIKNQKLVNWY